jgi:hypothetical protein
MSMYFREDTRVTIFEIEPLSDKVYQVKFGSGRKDKKTGEYANSTWSFTRFIGPAATKAKDLEPKDRIVLLTAWISKEPYMKDGEKLWPKNPQIVVWDFDWVKKADVNQEDAPPVVEDDNDDLSDDDLPF